MSGKLHKLNLATWAKALFLKYVAFGFAGDYRHLVKCGIIHDIVFSHYKK